MSELARANQTPYNLELCESEIPILALICSLVAAPVQAREAIHKGDVVVVPLRGEVAPSLLAFLRRAVKTAESNEASAIIFDMNTYGGRLDTATDIVNALNQTKIPTYTFINTNAGSAGSLIAIATHTHLHGTGERNWRSCTNPPNRRRPSHYGKGENDFVLVCAHPWFSDQERP